MDEAKLLSNHLKSSQPNLTENELVELVDHILDMRENFKVRYESILQFAEIFAGALINVDVENHSSFPRAVEIEDMTTGKPLGKIFFSPWQRKTLTITTMAGGLGRLRLHYVLTQNYETTPFMREGDVFRVVRPRISLNEA